MNAGTNFRSAHAHAQANADQNDSPWVIFLYGGSWWVDRLDSFTSSLPDGAKIIYPTTKKG